MATSPSYLEAMKSQFAEKRPLIQVRAMRRLELYTRLLGNRVPARILEVGSGTGWMVWAFNQLGVEALGVELEADLVASASALGSNVKQGDICQMNCSGWPLFDVVCASQTLEHITAPRLAIRNMVRLVRPGGLIHVDVPNAGSWGARVRRWRHGDSNWGVIALPHHQIGYQAKSLGRLLEDAGLTVLQLLEKPTNDGVYGQTIIPSAFRSRIAMQLSRFVGHGYVLAALAIKDQDRE